VFCFSEHMRLAVAVSLLLLSSAPAFAQTPGEAHAPVTWGPGEAAGTDPLWDLHYKQARTKLATGEFADAAAEFAELAKTARTGPERALAVEQGALAQDWATRNLAFVNRGDLGESNLSAKAVDRRTSDEIVSLYTNAVFFGIFTGAWFDVTAKTTGSTAGVVLPPLLAAGGAAGIVAAIDSGRGLKYGAAQSIVSGMYLGLEEGAVWLLWYATQPRVNLSGEAAVSVLWGTTTAGAVAGGIVGNVVATTPGRASWVGSTALWSAVVLGLGAGTFASTADGGRAALLIGAIGLNAGAVGGLITAADVSPSIARVRFLDLGGIVGFLVSGGLYAAAANKGGSGQAAAGITAVGTAAGLTTAFFATKGMHDDRPHGAPPDKPPAATIEPAILPAPGGGAIGVRGVLF
jgi:hypothetical protein